MVPTIEELREQCRIEHEYDDGPLLIYAAAAREAAENYLGRQLHDDKVPEEDATGMVITAAIKLAILLMAGHWYEHREDSSEVQLYPIPMGFNALLEPYRLTPP